MFFFRPPWWRDPATRLSLPAWPLVLGGMVWRGRGDFDVVESRSGEEQDRDALAFDYWRAALEIELPFTTPQLAEFGIPEPRALECLERTRPGVVEAFMDRSERLGSGRRAWESAEFGRRRRAYFSGMACAFAVLLLGMVIVAGAPQRFWAVLGGFGLLWGLGQWAGLPACVPRGAQVANLGVGVRRR